MRFTTVQKAFLAIIGANIIWSAASVIFKISLTNIPPFTLAFLRFALAPLFLFIILKGKVKLVLRYHKDLWLLIAYAVTGITGNIVFYFLGLQKTYAINASIIASAAPILTLFLAHTVLKEKLRFRTLIGFLLGATGLGIIILQPLINHGIDGSILGNFYLTLAVFAAVLQTIIGRSILTRYNPILFTFWAFIIGAASFLPLALYEYSTIPNIFTSLDWRGGMGIFYGSVFSSAVAYTLFAWGLSKISATDTSLVTHLDPVIGTILGYMFLHEPITQFFIFGAICIFTGIFVAEGRIHYHPLHKLKTLKPVHEPVLMPTPTSHESKPQTKDVIASLYNK